MPAAIPLAVAAVGAGASAIAGASGVGRNPYRATNFMDTNKYNPDAFQYGGQKGAADQMANYYTQQGINAQGRQGAQVDTSQSNWDRMQAGQARMGQQGIADAMGQRALGQVPSIAGMQANEQMRQLGQQSGLQMQQAQAAQAAQAASARGSAGLALAGQQAANNTANAQGQIGMGSAMAAQGISNQAQINAANERMQAEQAATGAYTNMRSGDQAQGGMAAQQSQYQAGLSQQQHGLNDQFQMGMTNASMGVRNAQLQAQMNQQGMGASQNSMAQGLNMGVNQNNANNETGFFKAGLGAVEGAAQMGASGASGAAPKAEGGPVEPGKPYLVGERGPELIIPKNHGLVIPAEQTPQVMAMYEPPGQQLQQGLGASGRGYLASDVTSDGRPSLEGPDRERFGLSAPREPSGLMERPAEGKPKTRTMTPSEMRAAADKLEKEMHAYYEEQMAAGPAVQAEGLMGGRVAPY
jgi:hypothetical protein